MRLAWSFNHTPVLPEASQPFHNAVIYCPACESPDLALDGRSNCGAFLLFLTSFRSFIAFCIGNEIGEDNGVKALNWKRLFQRAELL